MRKTVLMTTLFLTTTLADLVIANAGSVTIINRSTTFRGFNSFSFGGSGSCPAGSTCCSNGNYCGGNQVCIDGGQHCLDRSSARLCSNGVNYCDPGFLCVDGGCKSEAAIRAEDRARAAVLTNEYCRLNSLIGKQDSACPQEKRGESERRAAAEAEAERQRLAQEAADARAAAEEAAKRRSSPPVRSSSPLPAKSLDTPNKTSSEATTSKPNLSEALETCGSDITGTSNPTPRVMAACNTAANSYLNTARTLKAEQPLVALDDYKKTIAAAVRIGNKDLSSTAAGEFGGLVRSVLDTCRSDITGTSPPTSRLIAACNAAGNIYLNNARNSKAQSPQNALGQYKGALAAARRVNNKELASTAERELNALNGDVHAKEVAKAEPPPVRSSPPRPGTDDSRVPSLRGNVLRDAPAERVSPEFPRFALPRPPVVLDSKEIAKAEPPSARSPLPRPPVVVPPREVAKADAQVNRSSPSTLGNSSADCSTITGPGMSGGPANCPPPRTFNGTGSSSSPGKMLPLTPVQNKATTAAAVVEFGAK
jgi:hypothetical protein